MDRDEHGSRYTHPATPTVPSAEDMTGLVGGNGMPGPQAGPVCRLCGKPIGVYEPLVVIEQGRTRTTSRAAEPALSSAPGEYRHVVCNDGAG
jgi:hypothetical protein